MPDLPASKGYPNDYKCRLELGRCVEERVGCDRLICGSRVQEHSDTSEAGRDTERAG